ncbi:MAG TPA: DUF1592 domain-containing protein [Candidatus Limnocylindria bacterium]|nr:DUF1592 domain-containing protein [Candidatus Limnocylindria bacterium]
MFARQLQIFTQLALLCALAEQPRLEGAEPSRVPNGRDVYRQHCVKCHGKTGEGVKGKYDDALHGDWALEKLARYIDRNMPEDDPDKCDGPQSEAAARYIYDTFYSREARARNNPARVELVRLTNRQYLNTVADLLKQFAASDAVIGEERGLRANYQPRGQRRNRQSLDRVDRQVNFDFGSGTPFREIVDTNSLSTTNAPRKVTNEFSMNWRGSILADETGEYEFIVKTPNGTRLWVNDEDKPLIDASVASENLDEHKATVRLIGGRAYPLRLECFKAPRDKTSSVTLLWKPPHIAEQIIPARNLSPARASPTFVATTPFPPDDSSVGYERGVSVSKAWDDATTHAAIEMANYVGKNLDRLSRSKASDTNRTAKVQSFCNEFLAAAFRRPLSEEQKRLFVAAQFKNAKKLEDAVTRVVLLGLKSPRFLYLGLDERKPDEFEVAARLSFGLWDSSPDNELVKLATQGALRTPEQVNAQAQRMLADPRARSKMQYFLQHWLQMNHVDDLSKDAKLYPGFTPEIIADLRTSLNVFLHDAVWSGSSDYRKLLLADYMFVNNRLAEFYGMSTNATDDFVKVKVDAKERSGVVTHPYLLAAFSYQKSTSPIHRGVFLTRNIIGRALKSPAMAMTFKDSDFAPNLTMREKVAELTRPQACQGCHSVINPLGFSLEHYDAVGRFRTRENGKPINAASDYTTDDGETVRLTGGRDVAEFAATSEHAQNGFIEQLFHSIVKQPMLAYGPDIMDRLRASFVASEFNMQKLLVNIATVSALHGIEKPKSSGNKS